MLRTLSAVLLTFARTKIQPPRPRAASLLARPGLDARLGDALRTQRLVLLCAPAGFGKTSALARQIEHLPPGTALAWVACDADDSPLRLFRCLVAALEPYDLPWRTEPDALLAGVSRDDPLEVRQRALRTTAAELINALDASEVPHGVVVVDDLHRVEHRAVFEFLDLLLERLPDRWTFVVATRLEPPIHLARLRARGELAEFRAVDLGFQFAEAQALCAAAGFDAAVADALFRRTRGWPAGLKLALSVIGHANVAPAQAPTRDVLAALGPVIDRRVFEFLASEVVDRLPAAQREFLLASSVLAEMTASRCAALTGDAQAATRLEELESAGLFVDALAGSEPTLRLHELLRGTLLRRLERERPAELPMLYARAARTEPDAARRVTYLLKAGDQAGAADDLRQHAPALLAQGALSIVARLVDQFPVAAQALPELQQVRGLLAWARWDFETMAKAMQKAEAGYRQRNDTDGIQLAMGYRAVALNALGRLDPDDRQLEQLPRRGMRLETQLVVLLACLWNALDLERTERIGPLLDEMVDLLDTTDDPAMWYRGHPLPRLNGMPGTARALERYVDGALRLTADSPAPLRALAGAQRAVRAMWKGQFELARASLAAARDDSQWLGEPPNVRGTLQLVDMLLGTLSGHDALALDAARVMLADHPHERGPWSMAMHRYYAARTAAACGHRDFLAVQMTELEALRTRFPIGLGQRLLPLQAQRSWLEGDRPAAMAQWQRALAAEPDVDRLGAAVECRLRLAAAHLANGDDRQAQHTLAPAVQRVSSPDIALGGVFYARGVLPALASAARQGRFDTAVASAVLAWQQLAEASCPADAGAQATATAPDDSGTQPLALTAAPGPGLSPREQAVLELIAAGDSNKLIARTLALSPHTVKRHVANILDKLDLRSRGQAAAWFREHAG